MLAQNPGFTAVAVLTLALGIGATTAMFSVIEGAILDPFPYANTHRLATVVVSYPAYGPDYGWGWFPVQEFFDFRNQNHVFDEVISTRHDELVLTGVDVPVAFDGLKGDRQPVSSARRAALDGPDVYARRRRRRERPPWSS